MRTRRGEAALRREPAANVWLLMTIASAAAQATGDLVQHLGLRLVAYWLSPFTNSPLLLVGPALWFYGRCITRLPGEPAPTWKSFALHSVPAVTLCAAMAAGVLLDPLNPPEPSAQRTWNELLTLWPIALQILVYLGAVVRRVRGLRPRLEARFSNIEHRQLRWLEAGAFTFGVLVLTWIATWTMPVAASNIVTNGLLAAAAAMLGVFGARQLNVFARAPWSEVELGESRAAAAHAASSKGDAIDRLPQQPPAPSETALGERNDGLAAGSDHILATKYAKSALAPALAEAIARRLDEVMDKDKPYLENDLTLPDLAARVHATPHQLSHVLSMHIGMSFFEYVNGLRVDAVKATLARPQSIGRPLLEIALECGFGSKTAFNDAFKRTTDMSPSAYRRGLPGSAQVPGRPGTRTSA